MKTRSQTTCNIGCRADKSGPRPSVSNQTEVTGTRTKTSPKYPSEYQNRGNPNLGPLDPRSHKNISKAMRIKQTHEEYKEAVTAFYLPLKKAKGNTTKQTCELWRRKAGEHRSYIETNKLAKVRRNIMKKNRLTAGKTEEIKMKIRQPINTEQQNTEDARLRSKNLKPEQVENAIEHLRQGNEKNNIFQPVQQEERFEENETFVVENKEAIEEKKVEILEEFFKTQEYEHRRTRDTSEVRNKQEK